MSPKKDPITIETWLSPRAFPLSFIGKASVRSAELFTIRKPPPRACTIRKIMRRMAPKFPVLLGITDKRIEATVKITNPYV